jgi:hypothetical protein
MEADTFSLQQREALIRQIDRRIAKWPDEVILKLEALTRTPQAMANSQADQPSPVRETVSSVQRTVPADSGIESGQQDAKITRRRAFLFGVSGVMTLLAASTGTGWFLKTNELQSLRDRMTNHVNPLLAACEKAGVKKDASNQRIQNYQARILPMYVAILNLRTVTSQMSELFEALNENESLKKMDVSNIASIVFTLGDKVQTLANYIAKVPEMIQACQNILIELDGWFSEKNDVNIRLFQLLQQNLFQSIEEIRTQAVGIEQVE